MGNDRIPHDRETHLHAILSTGMDELRRLFERLFRASHLSEDDLRSDFLRWQPRQDKTS